MEWKLEVAASPHHRPYIIPIHIPLKVNCVPRTLSRPFIHFFCAVYIHLDSTLESPFGRESCASSASGATVPHGCSRYVSYRQLSIMMHLSSHHKEFTWESYFCKTKTGFSHSFTRIRRRAKIVLVASVCGCAFCLAASSHSTAQHIKHSLCHCNISPTFILHETLRDCAVCALHRPTDRLSNEVRACAMCKMWNRCCDDLILHIYLNIHRSISFSVAHLTIAKATGNGYAGSTPSTRQLESTYALCSKLNNNNNNCNNRFKVNVFSIRAFRSLQHKHRRCWLRTNVIVSNSAAI